MILGSHNTMTYLKPRKWWMWFGKFMAKCQKLTIEEQYEKGARFFDLRISFIEENGIIKPIFSHGLIDYKGEVTGALEFLNNKSDVQCRIIYEKGNDPELFKQYVQHWMTIYPNLKITSTQAKGNWINQVEPNTPSIPIKDCYASCNGHYPKYEKLPGILRYKSWSGFLIDDLWPWIYAKLHNKKNLDQYKDSDIILLIDFI